MPKHLGLFGAVALSVVATAAVAALFDVDWTKPWQVAFVVVVGVAVLFEVLAWRRRRHRPEASTIGPADLPDDVRRTINAHVADRKPINAVKVYRQATGAGLADAKRAIDNWPAV